MERRHVSVCARACAQTHARAHTNDICDLERIAKNCRRKYFYIRRNTK